MLWFRKCCITIPHNFQKILIVVALFTKWGNEWFMIRWRQTFVKRLLDWRANLSAQATGCQQGAIIQFGVQNPDLCSKSLNVYLKQGCVAETRDQFLFQRLLQRVLTATIWNLKEQLNSKLSSLWCAESDMEYLEHLNFEWVHAMSNHCIFFLHASIEPWAREGKQNLKSSLDQFGNISPIF